MITEIKHRVSPLCYLPSGKLVCYKNGKILIIKDNKIVSKILFQRSTKERIIGRCRYLYRLFRLGVRAAEAIDDGRIVLSIGNNLYELNIETGESSQGYFCGEELHSK